MFNCLLRLTFSLSSLLYLAVGTDFTIIGFFKSDETLALNAFNFAVEEANKNANSIQLKSKIITYSSNNESNIIQQVCDALLEKPVAIFGSKSDPAGSRIHMLATLKNIPHFQTDFSVIHYDDALRVYPPPEKIGAAIVSHIPHHRWEPLFILFESEGLVQLLPDIVEGNDERKTVFRRFPADGEYRGLIKEMEKVIKQPQVVIQAGLQTVQQFLQQLKTLNSTTEYHFIFTDLDIYTLDVMQYCNRCTMFGITLIQQNEQMDRLNAHLQKLGYKGIPTAAAVIYDSVMLLVRTLETLRKDLEPKSLDCQLKETWSGGSELSRAIRSAEYHGATGTIAFDSQGKRNTSFSFVNLTKSGFKENRAWTENDDGLQSTKPNTSDVQQTSDAVKSTKPVLRVAVILQNPFMKLKNSSRNTTDDGHHPYEGYLIDLLDKIAQMANFNYTVHEVSDGFYGIKNENGSWNGFVGELMRNEADIALADFTINSERSEVISFSEQFMDVGLGLVFKRSQQNSFSLFTVFAPLSLHVWLGLIGAYIIVSFVLLILGHLSPYDWYKYSGGQVDPEIKTKNKLNLRNSFWFTLGSLMLQGSDVAPRAISTRLVAGFWWIFVLVLTSSYIANLASFLTAKRMDSPIESIDDLVQQTKIQFGVLNNSAVTQFFRDSKIPTYERMWAFMNTHPTVFVQSDEDGFLRVEREKDYAYMTDSPGIEYHIERNCTLMQIGNLIYSKGFGIGLQKDSPYVGPINKALQNMKGSILSDIKEKWWKKESGESCQKESNDDSNALGISSVAGAFVFLLCGLILGFIVCILEYMYKAGIHHYKYKIERSEQRNTNTDLKKEDLTRPTTRKDLKATQFV